MSTATEKGVREVNILKEGGSWLVWTLFGELIYTIGSP